MFDFRWPRGLTGFRRPVPGRCRYALLVHWPIRRSLICCLLFALTVPLGLAVRFAPLHLSPFFYKYLGSVLWAVALYWFISMLRPRLAPDALFVTASVVALAVEFSRLMPERHIDAFRLTLAGRLLLGRYFSWKNITAYLLGIAAAALLDRSIRSRVH